jgi:hypothetical protein
MRTFYVTLRWLLSCWGLSTESVTAYQREKFVKKIRDEWNTEGVNGYTRNSEEANRYDDNINGVDNQRHNFAKETCNKWNIKEVNSH